MTGNNGLPQGWKLVELGEIVEDVIKVQPNENPEEEFIYLDISSIDNSQNIIVSPKRYLGKDAPSRARQLIKADDILFSTVRTYLKNIAQVPLAFDGQIASTGFCVIRPKESLNKKFYFYLALSDQFINPLSEIQRGTSYPAVRNSDVLEQKVPLPPLPEQERIVAKLEETFTQLEAGVAELQNVKAQLKRYRAAVLKSAVEGELTREWREAHRGEVEPADILLARILEERRKKWEAEDGKGKYKEPAAPNTDGLTELPDGWVWASLEQSASFEPRSIQSGPFGSSLLHSEFQETGILAIGIDNVLDGKFSMGKQHRISQKKYGELEKYTARPLDILITVMATVGRCCVVPVDLETAIITKHVYRISANQELINSYFLMYCILAESVTRHQIFGGVRGQTRPGINKSVLVNLAIPIPSLIEQERIVEKIERRLSVADEIEKELDESLVRAERLRGAVLKSAFEGRLV